MCEPLARHVEVYISDVKEVPAESMRFLLEASSCGIELLMVDALNRVGHPTHMSLDEALALIRQLRPTRSLLVGMDSCSLGDHEQVRLETSRVAIAWR